MINGIRDVVGRKRVRDEDIDCQAVPCRIQDVNGASWGYIVGGDEIAVMGGGAGPWTDDPDGDNDDSDQQSEDADQHSEDSDQHSEYSDQHSEESSTDSYIC